MSSFNRSALDAYIEKYYVPPVSNLLADACVVLEEQECVEREVVKEAACAPVPSAPLPSMAPMAAKAMDAEKPKRSLRNMFGRAKTASKPKEFQENAFGGQRNVTFSESEIQFESAAETSYDDRILELEEKLSERMKHLSDTFSEYLLYLIELRRLDNATVYKKALVDKKVFSKIKNNPDYHPQKLTALCLCVGAELSLDESKDLLARAGYAFSPCDKTDIIFQYFLENEIYDMVELDVQLEEHGLPCVIQ